MSTPAGSTSTPPSAVAAAHAALRSVAMMLPHLAGLAHMVRVAEDRRVPTACVFASGRLLVGADWFLALTAPERIFVMAHELLHLALRSHERGGGTNPRLFNVAHDYIINDMLRDALAMPIPANGLDWKGAAGLSAEALIAAMKSRGGLAPEQAWDNPAPPQPAGTLGAALAKAMGQKAGEQPAPPAALDVFDDATERDWFPKEAATTLRRARDDIAAAADRAVALGVWQERAAKVLSHAAENPEAGDRLFVTALTARTQPPWELALQRWLEDVAPGPRSYGRPSRRQGDRSDVVLAGRRREGWTLNIVLDTSGSMMWELPRVLGQIKGFCEALDIRSVRLLQCGSTLESDAIIAVDELTQTELLGGGSGDLCPGLAALARDPETEAAVVITDGYEDIPEHPPGFEVLWALTGDLPEHFRPSYGLILTNLIPAESE